MILCILRLPLIIHKIARRVSGEFEVTARGFPRPQVYASDGLWVTSVVESLLTWQIVRKSSLVDSVHMAIYEALGPRNIRILDLVSQGMHGVAMAAVVQRDYKNRNILVEFKFAYAYGIESLTNQPSTLATPCQSLHGRCPDVQCCQVLGR